MKIICDCGHEASYEPLFLMEQNYRINDLMDALKAEGKYTDDGNMYKPVAGLQFCCEKCQAVLIESRTFAWSITANLDEEEITNVGDNP